MLPAEYRQKLSQIDVTYNGTRPGEVGPCVARLESLGDILELVVGAFGEASSDLDRVITALAESRVLYLSRESPCGGLTVTSNPPVPALVGGGQECVKEDCGEQPGVTILLNSLHNAGYEKHRCSDGAASVCSLTCI